QNLPLQQHHSIRKTKISSALLCRSPGHFLCSFSHHHKHRVVSSSHSHAISPIMCCKTYHKHEDEETKMG
ncbi:hypothetical protein AKO1_007296, partial [Acrasis kona]